MTDDERYPDTESDADKRAYHNLLERKRRDHIKDSFLSLRDALPGFKGDKRRASRAQILKRAADFIQHSRRKNTAHQVDIAELKRENDLIEEQIRVLQSAISSGNYDTAVVKNIVAEQLSGGNRRRLSAPSTSETESDDDFSSDSGDGDDDDEKEPQRKKLKSSH